MLEPLIVLTVINCLFMFSSTLTTCALWWKYRNNHCCKKKAAREAQDRKAAKAKNNSHSTKKADKSKLDPLISTVSPDKLNSSIDDRVKSKKCEKKKSKTKLKYLSQFSQNIEPKRVANFNRTESLQETDKNLPNATRPTILLEFSTVQKVVQVLEKDVE